MTPKSRRHRQPDDPDARQARRTARRRNLRRAGFVVLFTVILGLLGGVAAFAIGYAFTPIPDPNRMVTSNTTVVYYSDGRTVLGSFAARNRISVPLDQVPDGVQNAMLAAENRSFWTDKGISPTGIARAAWDDLRGQSTAGGSTITQQYVKNYYLTQDQTWTRKIKELFITLKIQRRLSKPEILQDYLNTIYFGRGAYGIQTAAQAYFGEDVQDLTVEQGAVLAAVAKAPARYDPAVDKDNAARLEGRFRYVMDGLAKMDAVPAKEAAKARLPKLPKLPDNQQYAGPEGYLLVQAKNALKRLGYSEREIESGGLRVTTTFDVDAQKAAEKAVRSQFPRSDADGVHVGLASVRPSTGEVVAMYGGRDYLKRQFDDAVQAEIEPGSSFKAFALAAALDKGISLESRFSGHDPLDLIGGGEVHNEFNRDYGANVTLLQATTDSINTAFVDLTAKLGPQKVIDAAVRAGVPADSPGLAAVPLVALGNASVSPVDMANAYATFAAGGVQTKWHLIHQVASRTGDIRYESSPQRSRAFSADVTDDVTYALQQVVEHGTGTAAKALGRPAAGKTGTHEDRTAWFVGYTPQLATSVGFYREDGKGHRRSLDGVGGMSTFTGGGFPARIWTSYMKGALKGEPVERFPVPAHVGEAMNPAPTPRATATPRPSSVPASPSAPATPTATGPTATTTTPPPATPTPPPPPTTTPPATTPPATATVAPRSTGLPSPPGSPSPPAPTAPTPTSGKPLAPWLPGNPTPSGTDTPAALLRAPDPDGPSR